MPSTQTDKKKKQASLEFVDEYKVEITEKGLGAGAFASDKTDLSVNTRGELKDSKGRRHVEVRITASVDELLMRQRRYPAHLVQDKIDIEHAISKFGSNQKSQGDRIFLQDDGFAYFDGARYRLADSQCNLCFEKQILCFQRCVALSVVDSCMRCSMIGRTCYMDKAIPGGDVEEESRPFARSDNAVASGTWGFGEREADRIIVALEKIAENGAFSNQHRTLEYQNCRSLVNEVQVHNGLMANILEHCRHQAECCEHVDEVELNSGLKPASTADMGRSEAEDDDD